MKINHLTLRIALLIMLMLNLTTLSARLQADTGSCGGQIITLPFTDVMGNTFFCQIAAAYFSGLTNGTSATTYTPSQAVPREQMAAFVSRTLDQSVRRSSKRAALGRWWLPNSIEAFGVSGVQLAPQYVVSDGADLWVSNTSSNTITRVRASDGQTLGNYTGVPTPEGIIVVGNNVFVVSFQSPGKIYSALIINQPPSSMSQFMTSSPLGNNPVGITFDGQNLWTANFGTGLGTGSISKVELTGSIPRPSVTYATGFSQPTGILFDGSNLWVTDRGDDKLKRVDPDSGTVLNAISVGSDPNFPVFDGTNLWVPCGSANTVAVVRAVGGLRDTVLAQLTGNGLSGPIQAAFDGERILVTNYTSPDNRVSLWKAADLTPIGSFSLHGPSTCNNSPTGACSDGLHFWVTLSQGTCGVHALYRL